MRRLLACLLLLLPMAACVLDLDALVIRSDAGTSGAADAGPLPSDATIAGSDASLEASDAAGAEPDAASPGADADLLFLDAAVAGPDSGVEPPADAGSSPDGGPGMWAAVGGDFRDVFTGLWAAWDSEPVAWVLVEREELPEIRRYRANGTFVAAALPSPGRSIAGKYRPREVWVGTADGTLLLCRLEDSPALAIFCDPVHFTPDAGLGAVEGLWLDPDYRSLLAFSQGGGVQKVDLSDGGVTDAGQVSPVATLGSRSTQGVSGPLYVDGVAIDSVWVAGAEPGALRRCNRASECTPFPVGDAGISGLAAFDQKVVVGVNGAPSARLAWRPSWGTEVWTERAVPELDGIRAVWGESLDKLIVAGRRGDAGAVAYVGLGAGDAGWITFEHTTEGTLTLDRLSGANCVWGISNDRLYLRWTGQDSCL